MNHESSCISSLGKAASANAQRSGKLKKYSTYIRNILENLNYKIYKCTYKVAIKCNIFFILTSTSVSSVRLRECSSVESELRHICISENSKLNRLCFFLEDGP